MSARYTYECAALNIPREVHVSLTTLHDGSILTVGGDRSTVKWLRELADKLEGEFKEPERSACDPMNDFSSEVTP